MADGTTDKSARQVRAEKVAARFQEELRKPLVIEFSGTPKSGKSTTIEQVRAFLKRCGFKVEVVVERASVCPIRDKRHAHFNVWTSATCLAQLLEKTQDPPRADDPDVLILDRGVFDSIIWLRLLEDLRRLGNEERARIEDFLLLDRFAKRISGVVLMTAKPSVALQREQGLLPVKATGSIMNEEVLQKMFDTSIKCRDELSGKFKVVHIDTSENLTPAQSAEKAVDSLLDFAEELVEEAILHVHTSDLIKQLAVGLTTGEDAVAVTRAFETLGKFLPRESVEKSNDLLQPIPVAIVQNSANETLVLKRKEKAKTDALHDKVVVWAGGHVRREDQTLEGVLLSGLCRELEEELRLKISPEELEFLGIVYDSSREKSRRHVGLVYKWVARTPDVAIALSAEEFRERRGNSVSGTFMSNSELASTLSKAKIDEWTRLICSHFLGVSVPKDPSLFD